MKYYRPRLDYRSGWLLAVMAAINATPVIAETTNFGTFSLLPGFDQTQGKSSRLYRRFLPIVCHN